MATTYGQADYLTMPPGDVALPAHPARRAAALRLTRLVCTQGAETGDAGSGWRVLVLPAGARYLAALSWLAWSPFGAEALLALGVEAWRGRDGVRHPESWDALVPSFAVELAGMAWLSTLANAVQEHWSEVPVTLALRVTGAPIPAGATVHGHLAYLIDA
jgi:hypothetical protein